MKRISAIAITFVVMVAMISSFGTASFAAEVPDHPFVNFSSDRSTWFFRTVGGNNDVAFFDFFYPFDPTVKTRTFDPLAMYKLDQGYYFNDDGILMIHIDDLKKLYDPYFDYDISDNLLKIRHTHYNKLIIDGFGDRRTTIEYTKMVWDLSIDVSVGSSKNAGTYDYTEYEPTNDGGGSDINDSNSTTGTTFAFAEGAITFMNGEFYVPLAEVMTLMGKISFEERGYLVIQGGNMPDVTVEVVGDPRREGITNEDGQPVVIPDVLVPQPGNFWRCGAAEDCDPDYTWADYMDDVADGKRATGWLWRAFHIPNGASSKGTNGEEITIAADRIVPLSIYVPSRYHKHKTRLVIMLHGATGNENTTCDRLADRDIFPDQLAEDYNYIMASPNGWTREPQWRESQALYSFEESFEMVMDEFPVKDSSVFITGNSYGGKGTIELAMRFPGRFRAMAPTAAKIGDRGQRTGTITIPGDPNADPDDPEFKPLRITVFEEYINFEETGFGLNDIWAYDLSDIHDMPTMVVQGTGDTTTSYYFQIGNQLRDGPIVAGIMPKLTDTIYLVVEKGFHSYAYGTALKPIFDFFESQLSRCKKNIESDTLYIYQTKGKATLARIGGKAKKHRWRSYQHCRNSRRTRVVATEVVGDTVMIALSDLERIYGKGLKAYSLSAYAIDPEATVYYWTLIHNDQTLNFRIGETKYRRNMERYKMDVLSVARTQDQRLLDAAPEFSVAPYEKDGVIFVPLVETMDVLMESVVIVDGDNAGRICTKR